MVTKKELFRVPIFGKALEVGGFISIDRQSRQSAIGSLAIAKKMVEQGTHVWIAPEGTRSPTGELLPFKKGGFNLALEGKLPILPVTVRGSRDILQAKAVRSAPGARVRVTIHPPIDTDPLRARGQTRPGSAHRRRARRDRERAMNARTTEAADGPVARSSPRAGQGFAVLVNANAKRGGRRIAVQIARVCPAPTYALRDRPQELARWLAAVGDPRTIFIAGGDGTAVAFVNALAQHAGGKRLPPLGILPLGTGNGWAHACGAPKLDRCLSLLASLPPSAKLPVRRFGVFEVDGTLAHFAGSGWDAMIIDDYKQQLEESGPARFFTKSVYGYLTATLLRTVPKVTLFGNPRLVIENLGEEVFTITADGKLLKMHGVGTGDVIYDGPAGIAGVRHLAVLRLRVQGVSLRRAHAGHDERARLRSIRAGRRRQYPAPLEGKASAPGHARLVRHRHPHDVLPPRAASDRRGRARHPAVGGVPDVPGRHRHGRLAAPSLNRRRVFLTGLVRGRSSTALARTRTIARLARAARSLLAPLVALLLVVPLVLGASLPAYARVLAGPQEHSCRCGMEKGECGCPECNADGSRASHEGPTCSDCGGDAGGPSGGAAPDPVVLPAFLAGSLPHAADAGLLLSPAETRPEDPSRSPPTPPPRAHLS